MSGFALKLLALVLMIIDHCGLVLFAGTSLYLPCRILGRIAFPIYAFLITEGYIHTRNVKKYAGRLLAFALLSEIPFDYAFFRTPLYMGYQNVFFTLVLGLGALVCMDGILGRSNISKILLAALVVIAELAHVDYGAFGILVIVLFYLFRDQKVKCMASVAAALILHGFLGGFYIEGFGAIALIFILLYNGKKGQYPFPSLLFYAAYPLHLLILGLL